MTVCPVFYRDERTGISHSYYSIDKQYGTGRDFGDLAGCVATSLRLQADHEKERTGATSGKTGSELKDK